MEKEPEKLRMKELAVDDRPREKMMSKGAEALSNTELLAILIGTGTKEESVMALSQRIMKQVNNNLNELGRLSVSELRDSFHGIGNAKAILIAACMELGRRRTLESALDRPRIRSSQEAFEIFHSILRDLKHEETWALFLNRSNRIICRKKLGVGGTTASIVDIKLVMKEAVAQLASGIILCHNHPSGVCTPSEADRSLTNKMREACQWFDIKLLDHIIVGDRQYYSFSDDNTFNL